MKCVQILAVLCGAVAVVTAEEQKSEKQSGVTRLPEVTVTDKKEKPSITVPDVKAAEQEINQTPGGVDVIDAEDYKQGRAATLEDSLDFSPGVHAKSRFGAEETRLSIRGSGIQRTFHLRGIKLLQDGIPINTTDGGADFQSIDPLALRYIEVYRGANALRYGSSTLGGAINFVMPTGHDANRWQARVEGGSFEYLRGQLSSGHAYGPFDYYLSLSHSSMHGFRDHADQSNQRLFTNFAYRFNDHVETRFYVNTAFSDSELPGNLTKAQMEDDPEQANAGNVALDQERDLQYYRVGNKTAFDWGDHRLVLGAFWAYQDLDHPIFQVIDQNTYDYGFNARYVSEMDWFSNQNILTLGANAGWGHTVARQFVNVGGHRGAKTADGLQEPSQYDFYVENQHYILDKLALVAGAQIVYAVRDFEDRFLTNGDQSDSQDFFGVNPKIGARYEFTDDIQAFANFSRSFEPPSFGELSNLGGSGLLELDAQTAWTIEVGTRGEWKRVTWDLAFYYAWLRDELLSFNIGAGGGPPSRTLNADKTIHFGVEAGVNVALWEGLFARDAEKARDQIVLRQTYTWGEFRFDDDAAFGDNRLPGLPPHFFRAELMYEHPKGFYGGPNVEWSVVKYPVDMANTLYADPYAIVGFRAGYRSKKGFSIFFEAKNLTDEIYAAATGVITTVTPTNQAQFLPGDGRAFYGGVEWRW